VECHQQAIDLYRDLGDRYYEASAHAHLGDTYIAAGNAAAAKEALSQALRIYTDLGQSEAEAVRAKLSGLDQEFTSPKPTRRPG
jgi:tetratricopeptide (TPR) repeat protein